MTDRLTNQPTDRPGLGSNTFKKLFKASSKFTLLLLLYNIQALQTCFIHVSYSYLHFIDIIDETDDDTDPPPAPSVRPEETLEDDVTEEEARTEERTAER